MKALFTFVLALACNAVYADDAPVYTQAQIDADWDRRVALMRSMSAQMEKTRGAPVTPEQKRLNDEKYQEYLREGAEEMRKNPNMISDELEARRQKAAEIEATRQRIINFRPHGNSIPPTPAQTEFENRLADGLDVPREQLAAMYAADRAKLQENQALLKQVQQQYAESTQRVADERAAEEARRQRAARFEEMRAQHERDYQEMISAQRARAADTDRFVAQMNRRTDDMLKAHEYKPAPVPAQPSRKTAAPATRPDPLAPNSAMQAEAEQARKGTGTDLCPHEISDIECANRLNWLKEQARGR
jgi:hypothetical protein